MLGNNGVVAERRCVVLLTGLPQVATLEKVMGVKNLAEASLAAPVASAGLAQPIGPLVTLMEREKPGQVLTSAETYPILEKQG